LSAAPPHCTDAPPRAARISRQERAYLWKAWRNRECRSHELLRQWLSPAQAEQYDKFRSFDVVGSHTGKRYRIYCGTVMNVAELDAATHEARRWCFVPEGAIATGDVMLAQKIALETFEADALAIANGDGPECARRWSGSFLHISPLSWLVLTFACFLTLVWSLAPP
jgi:hypothetical protein